MTEVEILKNTLFVQNKVGDIKFYPGTDRDVTEEDFAREMNAFLASLASGSEEVEPLDSVD